MIDDSPSYLPPGKFIRFEEADQLPGYRPIWMRIEHVLMDFQRHRDTGRRWTWARGWQVDSTGAPLGRVETPVWVSALPLHEPEAVDPVLCARCDPPAKWPCPPAKARMLADHEGDRHGLCVYLARHLGTAKACDPPETPRDTYDRIVGWSWESDAVAVFGR